MHRPLGSRSPRSPGKGLAAGFTSLENFNRPDVEIAVKLGTTAVTSAKKFLPKATLRMFDTEPQAYQELRNGKVHAVVGMAPRPTYEAVDAFARDTSHDSYERLIERLLASP